jgi:hypothetical protein
MAPKKSTKNLKVPNPLFSAQPNKPVPKSDNGWSQFEEWAGQHYFQPEPLTPPFNTTKPITNNT